MASLEELARFGCPVDLSVAVQEVEENKLEIEQVGGLYESHIFQLPDNRLGCMAWIAVTNQRSRTLDLIDVELRAPWDGNRFQWLQPIEVNVGARAERSQIVYRFPGGPEFRREEVLNCQLVERNKLPGQRRSEGWLLAAGSFMPDEFVHGQEHDLIFTITGSDHVEYCARIQVWTERLLRPKKVVERRRSIFAPHEIEGLIAPDKGREPAPVNIPEVSRV